MVQLNRLANNAKSSSDTIAQDNAHGNTVDSSQMSATSCVNNNLAFARIPIRNATAVTPMKRSVGELNCTSTVSMGEISVVNEYASSTARKGAGKFADNRWAGDRNARGASNT